MYKYVPFEFCANSRRTIIIQNQNLRLIMVSHEPYRSSSHKKPLVTNKINARYARSTIVYIKTPKKIHYYYYSSEIHWEFTVILIIISVGPVFETRWGPLLPGKEYFEKYTIINQKSVNEAFSSNTTWGDTFLFYCTIVISYWNVFLFVFVLKWNSILALH